MKLFISWSGSTSHQVALALRDWLPSVLQTVEPYVSSEDIDKGARWSTDISQELEESSFGVLCVVPDNLSAPWLNFEAGALSKAFEKGRVSPFLFGLKRAEVPPGPLLQFQSTIYEKGDVYKLVHSINDASGDTALETTRLNEALDVWWTQLEDRLSPLLVTIAAKGAPPGPVDEARGTEDVLEEILELVREQQRLITSPQALLPADYVEHVMSRYGKSADPASFRALDRAWSELVDVALYSSVPIHKGLLLPLLERVEEPLVHILRSLGRRRPRTTVARHVQRVLAGEEEDVTDE